jgi:hypothetical protein
VHRRVTRKLCNSGHRACEIASIHAVCRGFAQGKLLFGCVGAEIPAVQIGGSDAWIVIVSQPATAKEVAEEVDIRSSAAQGAFDFERLAVSLKRYPDTKLEWFAQPVKLRPFKTKSNSDELH